LGFGLAWEISGLFLALKLLVAKRTEGQQAPRSVRMTSRKPVQVHEEEKDTEDD
jgi:hypothetical protein